ncbi:MAG: TRAP transporter small permease [Rhizobiales bacterium]|nr:TRAP transporter small permease [Hyphomicrobiales bacterium]
MGLARRILDPVANLLLLAAGVSIVLMMVIVVADAVARSLFNGTVPGSQELAANYFMVAVTFLPLACVQRDKSHVIIELFTGWMPPRAVASLDAVVYLACASGTLVFCYATYFKALAMTRAGEYAVGTVIVTIWPTRWLVVAGALVLALYLLLNAAEEARAAILGRPAPGGARHGHALDVD